MFWSIEWHVGGRPYAATAQVDATVPLVTLSLPTYPSWVQWDGRTGMVRTGRFRHPEVTEYPGFGPQIMEAFQELRSGFASSTWTEIPDRSPGAKGFEYRYYSVQLPFEWADGYRVIFKYNVDTNHLYRFGIETVDGDPVRFNNLALPFASQPRDEMRDVPLSPETYLNHPPEKRFPYPSYQLEAIDAETPLPYHQALRRLNLELDEQRSTLTGLHRFDTLEYCAHPGLDRQDVHLVYRSIEPAPVKPPGVCELVFKAAVDLQTTATAGGSACFDGEMALYDYEDEGRGHARRRVATEPVHQCADPSIERPRAQMISFVQSLPDDLVDRQLEWELQGRTTRRCAPDATAQVKTYVSWRPVGVYLCERPRGDGTHSPIRYFNLFGTRD